MARGLLVHRFGPFELDIVGRRLYCDGTPIPLSDKRLNLLSVLVEHAGEVVSAETLLNAAWPDTAVSDNNLDKAISHLRRNLALVGGDTIYIETVVGHGYRFVAPVELGHPRVPATEVDQLLGPFDALEDARLALVTLDLPAVRQAMGVLETTVREIADSTQATLDMALGCGIIFESDPNAIEVLRRGIALAQLVCTQSPASAEAWSILSYLHGLHGDMAKAASAANRATALDPEYWRIWLLKARVSWGETRLRAARQLLKLCPGLALGHWLRTTVFIAREAHDLAMDEVLLGCAAQEAQPPGAPYAGVGSFLLKGHLFYVRGQIEDAIAAIKKELDTLTAYPGHIHARECGTNCQNLLGVIYRAQRQRDKSLEAFHDALKLDPANVAVLAALHGQVPASGTPMEIGLARSIVCSREGRTEDAAHAYHEGLCQSPAGWIGWMLSIEPMLEAWRHPEIFKAPLALVRSRAV